MSNEEITRQQLEAVRDHLMIQYGSVLCLTLAFLLFVLAAFLVVFNWRRAALAIHGLIGGLTFMVPTPVTFYLSPVVILGSAAGIVWITMRRRADSKAASLSARGELQPQAGPAAV